MKNSTASAGFVWLPALIGLVLAALLVGGGVYVAVHKDTAPGEPIYQPDTTTPDTTQTAIQATINTPPHVSSGNSSSSEVPTIAITNVSGLTVTVQYTNLIHTPDGDVSPVSLWVQNEGLGKPSLKVSLGDSSSGTATFTLPANSMEGSYGITAVGINGEGYTALNSSPSAHPASASFYYSRGSISPAAPVSFSATPTSGIGPLTVTFSSLRGGPAGIPDGYDINFGDGSKEEAVHCDFTDDFNCLTSATIQHVYTSAGTYTASLNAFNTPTCSYSGSPIACPTKDNRVEGTITIVVTGIQSFPAGMSKYTDTDFGFSFWYPTSWQITSQNNGLYIEIKEQQGTYPRSIGIAKAYRDDGIVDASGACGSCSIIKYYFDKVAHVWMQTKDPVGNGGTVSQADVSHNTMGGLHIFPDGSRFGGSVVPLTAKNFLLISGDDGGSSRNFDLVFTRTIMATDPTVATPVSADEQRQTVQTEKSAYILNQF